MNIKLNSHQHPLILVHKESTDFTIPSSSSRSNLLSCHNPMKKIELLCNGCLRPITSFPFYKCVQHCNFVLHEWCTRLPTRVKDYMGHPQHTLTLYPSVDNELFSMFICDVCELPCNGFAYSCVQCNYRIDVTCAFIHEKIAHNAHPEHPLLWHGDSGYGKCILCLNELSNEKNAYTYKGEYFCEVCEEEFNPQRCFYHCYQCTQSIHSSCAPLILQSETATSSDHDQGVYEFLNMKCGGIHRIKDHPHDLFFVQGTAYDGKCNECGVTLRYKMNFKCEQCKFAIDFKCCKRLSGYSPIKLKKPIRQPPPLEMDYVYRAIDRYGVMDEYEYGLDPISNYNPYSEFFSFESM